MTASEWNAEGFFDGTTFLSRSARDHARGARRAAGNTTGVVRHIPAHARSTASLTGDIPGIIGGLPDDTGSLPGNTSGAPGQAMSLSGVAKCVSSLARCICGVAGETRNFNHYSLDLAIATL